MKSGGRRVVVSGIGMVTPFGRGVAACWRGAMGEGTGESCVRSIVEEFTWAEALPCRIAARVPACGEGRSDNGNGSEGSVTTTTTSRSWPPSEMIQGFGSGAGDDGKKTNTAPRFVQFAIQAADDALFDAGWFPNGNSEMEEATGVSIGNSIGNVDDVFDAGVMSVLAASAKKKKRANGTETEMNSENEQDMELERALALRKKVSPFFVPRILVNMASGAVSIKHKLRGPSVSSSTACAAGAHAIGEAMRVISSGEADVMVAGGSESCINLIAMAGFCKARALSTAFNDAPGMASRPFDGRRDGFVMAEGAAILILESAEHAQSRGAAIYCELSGAGSSNDGFHVTHPDPSGRGAELAMRRALKSASLDPARIGYVNAHATSTPVGDEIEMQAITRVFKDSHGRGGGVPVSSTKGATGHLLSAAGAVEAALTAIAVNCGKIPPTINLESPLDTRLEKDDPLSGVRFVTGKGGEEWQQFNESSSLRAAISNSFGFGGTNASLVFQESSANLKHCTRECTY